MNTTSNTEENAEVIEWLKLVSHGFTSRGQTVPPLFTILDMTRDYIEAVHPEFHRLRETDGEWPLTASFDDEGNFTLTSPAYPGVPFAPEAFALGACKCLRTSIIIKSVSDENGLYVHAELSGANCEHGKVLPPSGNRGQGTKPPTKKRKKPTSKKRRKRDARKQAA